MTSASAETEGLSYIFFVNSLFGPYYDGDNNHLFYDCDFYLPALDTFDYFWDRIVPGGYLLIHDYEAEEGGYAGVKKATDEFFGPRKIKFPSFYENTMAVIRKE